MHFLLILIALVIIIYNCIKFIKIQEERNNKKRYLKVLQEKYINLKQNEIKISTKSEFDSLKEKIGLIFTIASDKEKLITIEEYPRAYDNVIKFLKNDDSITFYKIDYELIKDSFNEFKYAENKNIMFLLIDDFDTEKVIIRHRLERLPGLLPNQRCEQQLYSRIEKKQVEPCLIYGIPLIEVKDEESRIKKNFYEIIQRLANFFKSYDFRRGLYYPINNGSIKF